ncbi:hypothetical protein CHS0354_013116 [Potamilus streckersoni]|uniref:Band 7 domain-containing protein n=1 Tax=Potamilus streckersoni TaxID=2493646 RepID=A0AAE0S6F4_9BIVA|nr:hypothetical protein CHS0354_013116 [Potamilus streckersoni]
MQRVNVDIIRKEEFGFTSNSAGVYVRKNNSPTYTDEESLMLTGDKNVINLNWVVQYRIISPKNYLFNIADISGTVRDISETVLRRLVGNRDFDYVLNNREELAYAAKSEMQLFLDKYESGIALEAVQLLDVTPPEPVRPSFNEVNEADQDRTRLVNEAQREYNEKIPRARGEAKQLIQEAEGYKVRRVNTAEGEVARYNEVYTQYKRYPSVTRQRIYIETLREVLPGVNEILVVDQNKNIVPLLNLSVLLAFLLLYNAMFIVRETEQVVITEFGKPVGYPITSAGLHFKLPFIQKAIYFDKRILSWDGQPREIPTNDKTFIWVECAARWKITKPLLFLQRLGTEDRAISIMNALIDGAIRDLVTKNDLTEIILSSDWKEEYVVNTETSGGEREIRNVKVGRDRYSENVRNSIRQITNDYGIEIMDILIKRVNYTDQVRNKVYERMISERKRIAAKKRSEGEGEKAEILGQLERELSNIQSTAEKTANQIKGQADGQAGQIYGKSYMSDPDFYRFYQTLQSYRDIVKGNTKLVVSMDSDLYKYLKDIK